MGRFQIRQKTLVIRMPGELDHHSAKEIPEEADHLLTQRNINRIEFDFRDTDFMDSSGIGVIMGRYQKVHLLGGSVTATHVNDRIYRILQLAGLTKIIGIEKERFWNQE